MLFVLTAISLAVLFHLVNTAQRFGRYDIWREPIRGKYIQILPAVASHFIRLQNFRGSEKLPGSIIRIKEE